MRGVPRGKKGRRGQNLRGRKIPGSGRKPGQENKVTAFTRQFIQEFLNRNSDKVQALFDKVSKKQPAVAMRMLTDLCEFALPKLARVDNVVTLKRDLKDLTDEEIIQLLAERGAQQRSQQGETGGAPPRQTKH